MGSHLAAQLGEDNVRVLVVEDGDLSWSRMCQVGEIHLCPSLKKNDCQAKR